MFDDEHGSLELHVGSDGSEQSCTSFDPHCEAHVATVALFVVDLCMQHTKPDVQSALDVQSSDAAPFGHAA